MIDPLQPLIAALREELQHYGEMLALLDQQQEQVVARATDELHRTVSHIQAQAKRIQACRATREQCQRDVARFLVPAAAGDFADLIPQLPADYQPLVRALVNENNELLARVQQRARQNHLLLSRSVELMQRLISSLLPSRETLVYNDHGTMLSHVLPVRPLYEAVG